MGIEKIPLLGLFGTKIEPKRGSCGTEIDTTKDTLGLPFISNDSLIASSSLFPPFKKVLNHSISTLKQTYIGNIIINYLLFIYSILDWYKHTKVERKILTILSTTLLNHM